MVNFIDEGQSLSVINTTDVIFQEGSASNILSIDEGLSLNEDQSLDEAQNLDEDQSLDEYQSLAVIDPTEAIFQKGSTPNLLSTIQREVIPRLRVVASWRGRRPRDNSLSAVYTAPPGFVILSVQTVVHSSNNGSRSVSVLGSNFSLVTETDLTEVYNQFINVALSKNDQQLKGNLEQKMNSHINELRKYQSTHNAIEAIVKASTHGNIFDRKRGWEEISVFAELMYLGGSKPDVAASLEREFSIKTSVPVAQGDDMQPGEVLNPGQSISSMNGQYTFVYQGDGNLVLYRNRDGKPLWGSANTWGKTDGVCIMQGDGNLVIYDSNSNPIWASETWQHPGSRLVVQDDGNVVMYSPNGTPVWGTNTWQG